jgi:hypothetical protein
MTKKFNESYEIILSDLGHSNSLDEDKAADFFNLVDKGHTIWTKIYRRFHPKDPETRASRAQKIAKFIKRDDEDLRILAKHAAERTKRELTATTELQNTQHFTYKQKQDMIKIISDTLVDINRKTKDKDKSKLINIPIEEFDHMMSILNTKARLADKLAALYVIYVGPIVFDDTVPATA